MKKSKLIKEIIGNSVKEYGFQYAGYGRDGYTTGYDFLRLQGDIRQKINITVIEQDIRLMLMTNVYGGRCAEATDLIESDFQRGYLQDFLYFKDEEEFKAILYHFRDIILRKGLELFEELSIPLTEIRPKKETDWKLYQEHDELNEKYRKMYGLEDTEYTTRLIRRISEIILETIEEDFSKVEEMLIGLAAVYADQVIRKCGGEWTWVEDCNTCVIIKVRGYDCINPLNDTISYWRWKKENLNHFLNAFRDNPYDTVR